MAGEAPRRTSGLLYRSFSGLADSAFEHRALMAEGKHLGAELRIGARSNEHEVSNEADELTGEAQKQVG